MDLAISRLFNEFEDDIMNQMTKAEYNQFVCGISKNMMTPYEAEEYFNSLQEREWEHSYEKLYRMEEEF